MLFLLGAILLGVSDGSVVFFIANYVHKESSVGLSNCNYYCFVSSLN